MGDKAVYTKDLHLHVELMLKALDKKIESVKMKVEKLCDSTSCFERLCNNDKKTTQFPSEDEPTS